MASERGCGEAVSLENLRAIEPRKQLNSLVTVFLASMDRFDSSMVCGQALCFAMDAVFVAAEVGYAFDLKVVGARKRKGRWEPGAGGWELGDGSQEPVAGSWELVAGGRKARA